MMVAWRCIRWSTARRAEKGGTPPHWAWLNDYRALGLNKMKKDDKY